MGILANLGKAPSRKVRRRQQRNYGGRSAASRPDAGVVHPSQRGGQRIQHGHPRRYGGRSAASRADAGVVTPSRSPRQRVKRRRQPSTKTLVARVAAHGPYKGVKRVGGVSVGPIHVSTAEAAFPIYTGLKKGIEAGTPWFAKTLKNSPGVGSLSKLLKGATTTVGTPGRPGHGSFDLVKTLGNVPKDAIDLPASVPTSLYLTARHPIRTVQQFPKTDPWARLILHGDPKGIEEHPVVAGLEVSGGKALAGRGAGGALRHAPSKTLRKVGSIERKPLKLYENMAGGPVLKREYSRDVSTKSAQVLNEALKRKRGKDPHAAASRRVAPTKRLLYDIGRRVDEDVHVAEGVRRAHRDKARQVVKAAEKSVPKHHRPGLTLVAARIIRRPDTILTDLQRYRDQITAEVRNIDLTHAEAKHHVDQVIQIDALLHDRALLTHPQALFDAAKPIIEQANRHTKELQAKGLLKEEHANAKLVPYAVTHMAHKPGDVLDAAAVRAHMAKNGVDEPAYFSQAEGGRNPHYSPLAGRNAARPKMNIRQRTGAASARGTFRLTDVLDESASRAAGDVSQAASFDRFANEFGIHKPLIDRSGKVIGRRHWESYDRAKSAAAELSGRPETGGLTLTPVNIGRLRQVHDLLDQTATPTRETITHVSDAIAEAFRHDPGGRGQYLLMPSFVKDRLLAHQAPRGPLDKWLQDKQRIFKETVLPFSTKWLLGNAVDVSQRSLMHGLTPLDYIRGRKVMSALEKHSPETALRVREGALGGQHYGSHELTTRHYEPGRIAGSVPGRAVRWPIKKYQKAILRFNGVLERQPQYAALGKVARRETKMTVSSLGGFFRVSEQALDDFVRGLEDSPAQIKAQRYVEDVSGRWGKNSPVGKKILLGYAPFGQWLRVALKYIYYTLPHDHPIKTGILAALDTMTEEERKKLGLSLYLSKEDRKPDSLQGSIPTSKGMLRVQGFSSFGIPAAGAQGVTQAVIPQYTGAARALEGKDWLGRDIKGDPSINERAALAFYILGEAHVPGLSVARRLREKGGSSEPTSNIFNPQTKPDSGGGGFTDALNRVFNPLRPTANTPKKKVRRSSGSGGGSSYSAPPSYGGGYSASGMIYH